jgi:hypothetical protein
MDNTKGIILILLYIVSCFFWYRTGKCRGEIKMRDKLERDILYVESLMIAAEKQRGGDIAG